MGEALALGGDLEGAETVSSHVADPILLASTSPQRRVILEQLGLPFDVVPPEYAEHDPPDADVYDLVLEHARGKARSVAHLSGSHRPVLGVDTAVAVGGAILGKPADAAEAERMLERLSGKTHVVVSGLCLLTAAWEVVEHEATSVSFRELTPRELGHHLAHGELIDLLNASGFQLERLVELYAPEQAETHGYYDFVTAEWARKWPAEELWVARKR